MDANIAKSDAVAKITELGDLTSELDAVSMKLTPVKEPSKLIGEMEVLSGDASREPLVLTESSHVSVKNKEVSAGFESFELEADPLCHSSTVTCKCDGEY